MQQLNHTHYIYDLWNERFAQVSIWELTMGQWEHIKTVFLYSIICKLHLSIPVSAFKRALPIYYTAISYYPVPLVQN